MERFFKAKTILKQLARHIVDKSFRVPQSVNEGMQTESMIVAQFRQYLAQLGYSESSRQMLPACLQEFFHYTGKATRQIQPEDIKNYHDYLQERPNQRRAGGLSEQYINHHIYSLKVFFTWQIQTGRITQNPISSLTFEPPKTQPRQIFTQAEIKELYQACNNRKEKALLAIYYGCGLRRQEGVNLNLNDLHFRSNLLHVRSGKGGKRRVVPMSDKVKADLQDYIYHERFAKSQESGLFTNYIGKRNTGNTLNTCFKTILERTGMKKEASLHHLRHSIASHLLENGLPVNYVRDFLGHKHLESTQIYTRINNQQLWNL